MPGRAVADPGPRRPGGPDARARPAPREGAPRAPLVRAGLRRPVVLAAPATRCEAFITETQRHVTGEVRLRFAAPGTCTVVGRRSPVALYDHDLATYDASDSFRHAGRRGLRAAVGTGCGHVVGPPGPGCGRRDRFGSDRRGRRANARGADDDAVGGTDRDRDGGRRGGVHREPALRPGAGPRRPGRVAGARQGVGQGRHPERQRGRRAARRARSRRGGVHERPVRLRARRRGHPHRDRAAGHRAGGRRRRQAAHRPQPQRPGGHRRCACGAGAR